MIPRAAISPTVTISAAPEAAARRRLAADFLKPSIEISEESTGYVTNRSLNSRPGHVSMQAYVPGHVSMKSIKHEMHISHQFES